MARAIQYRRTTYKKTKANSTKRKSYATNKRKGSKKA